MSPSQSLAKIQIPHVSDVYQRKNLFSWLDKARKQPIIWISAGAGSGKTTLVASYLKKIDYAAIWYQMDSGDDDIASFFLNMGLAAKKAAPRKRKTLPHLTPEYLQNIHTFTRNFFRELYNRLKQHSVLVFDNYETVPETSALHEIMCYGLAEIAQGINVIIVSRLSPPPAFARLRASDKMPILKWENLHLNLNECSEIIRIRTGKVFPEKDLRSLYNRTNGWIAGLVLALEQLPQKEPCHTLTNDSGQTAIYNYFDHEIFKHISPKQQEFMLKTAILPQMTIPMVKALTGAYDAEQILRYLVDKNFFTVLKPAKIPSYAYHDLFHSFLKAKAEQVFDKDRFKNIMQIAANLLEKAGQIEEAAVLYHRLKIWRSLLNLIVKNARFLLGQGRTNTLVKWISLLPKRYQKNEPWVLYWLGECQISVDPIGSRKAYEKAFHKFSESKNPVGVYQSWAGVIESFVFFLDDLEPLSKWVDCFKKVFQNFPKLPDPETEVRVVNCMISALMFQYTHHKELTKWAYWGESLIKKSPSPDVALRMNGLLIPYCGWIGNYPLYRFVVDLQRKYLEKASQLYLARLKFYIAEAHLGWLTAEWGACDNAIRQAKKLAKQTGIHLLENEFISAEIYRYASSTGEINRLDQLIKKLESVADIIPALMRANIYYLKGWINFLKKDLDQAYFYVDTAITIISENSGPPFIYALCHLSNVQVQFERGEDRKAEESLEEALRIGNHMAADNLLYHGYCLKAYYAFKGHLHADGLPILKMAIAVGSKAGIYNVPWWRPKIMAYLCKKALENEIESSFVRSVIRKRDLFPESHPSHVQSWPWQVKIYTFGKFRLLKEDKEISFSRKAPKKPIELLKSLISYGMTNVPVTRIADALWPDAEGDSAYQAFTMALQRIRNLLGNKKALILNNGTLSINTKYCWVDVHAFESSLQNHTKTERKLEYAISLYEGPFLFDDTDSIWAIHKQSKLRRKFVAAITLLANIQEKSGNWKKAIILYEKGLEADDVCEDFYRKLMFCHGQLDQQPQISIVFEECQKIFKAKFNIQPSNKTIGLYKKLIKSSSISSRDKI